MTTRISVNPGRTLAICVPVKSGDVAEQPLFNHQLTYENDKTGTQTAFVVGAGQTLKGSDMQKRTPVRDLQPMSTGLDEELRIAIVSVGKQRRLTLTSWSRGGGWHELGGHIEIPLELLPVLSARLRAAVAV